MNSIEVANKALLLIAQRNQDDKEVELARGMLKQFLESGRPQLPHELMAEMRQR